MDAQEWEQHVADNHARNRRNLAETVRFYRLLRRMTVRDLAAASGCALDTIYRIEHQKGDTRMGTQGRIAEALGVSWQDLVTGQLPERPQDISHLVNDRRQMTVYEALDDQESTSRAARRRKKRQKQRSNKPEGKRKK